MAEYDFDWTTATSNGETSVGVGDDVITVGVSSGFTDGFQTAAVQTQGTPFTEALWVQGLSQEVTTQLVFSAPVENLSFEIFNIDQNADLWDDKITIIATNELGETVEISFSDLNGTHVTSGDGTIDASGAADLAVNTVAAADSVSVSIAGPIQSLTFIFDAGESADVSGSFGISDLHFESAPIVADAIVQGTALDDSIDLAYVGDPEGDLVSLGDDVIYAGAGDDRIEAEAGDDLIFGEDGNDTVLAGTGSDTVFGNDGADSVELGSGNDVLFGGDGDDWVNGDLGNDVLHGGAGNDYLRGSYGQDTIFSGGTGEGDDFLWGGYNDDLFVFEDGFGNDTVEGEDIDETFGDTIDLSAVTDDLRIDLSSINSGVGNISDGTSTAIFEGVENLILGGGADTIVLADGSGFDRVTDFVAPVANPDGSFVVTDVLDVSAVTRDYGSTPVTTRDVTVTSDSDGNAVLTFPQGDALTLVGVDAATLATPEALEAIGIPAASDGIVTGTAGNDLIYSGYLGDNDGDRIDNEDGGFLGENNNQDHVQAGAGDDLVFAGQAADSVEGGAGEDIIYGGGGNDTLLGEGDADNIFGEAGADLMFGGEGDDTLTGGEGADTLSGGEGADLMFGGQGSDLFVGGSDGDAVFGGEDTGDVDVLSLLTAGPLRVNYDPDNSENGTVDFLDGLGNVTGTMSFEGIETVVTCFTPGSHITTNRGLMQVQDLRIGDRVLTRDRGYQDIRWVGRKDLGVDSLLVAPHLTPVTIQKGALGDGLPARDIKVSPNHRVLVSMPQNGVLFGEVEVLVAAKHLVGKKGIFQTPRTSVSYIHFLCDHHELVQTDSLWTESFQPGAYTLNALQEDQRNEIFEIFPELEFASSNKYLSARRVLRRHEAAILTI